MTARFRSDEEKLIFLGAGIRERRDFCGAEAEHLGGRVDWNLLTQILQSRRLLTTLGPRLVVMTGSDGNRQFAAVVDESLERVRRQGTVLQLAGSRVTSALADAGIRSSPLKGPWLSEALYGDSCRRVSTDIDLLVPPDQLQDAVSVVADLGYDTPQDSVDPDGFPLLHFVLPDGEGMLPPIELHWRIHWYERRYAADRLLVPSGHRGDATWQPAPIDLLTSLLLFYARDGFIDLRLATDVSACWDRYGADLQDGELDRTIDSYPSLERVLLAALDAAKRVVGLPTNSLVRRYRKLPRRSGLAARLANPHPHSSVPQLYADIGLVDGLLAPPGGFWAFFGRQVAPRREPPLDVPLSWRGRLRGSVRGRSIRVLARYALASPRLFLAGRAAGLDQ